jgi:hypothetical protein
MKRKLDLSSRTTSALISKFDDSVEQLPMRDAMRYTMLAEGKWTASEFKVKILPSTEIINRSLVAVIT